MYLEFIKEITDKFILDIKDSSFAPAGNNGPYNEDDLPTRNTAHWLVTLKVLCQYYDKNEYRDVAKRFAEYLLNENKYGKNKLVKIRNMKNPKLVMCGVLTGSFLNIILDYVFVFPMDMGMFGAALATVIGSVTTVLVLSTHFIKKQNRVKINKETISLKLVTPILKCGFSSLIMEVANGFVIFIFNIQILKYIGNNGIVVYGIISNCVLVGLALFNGVAQAAQPIIATNFGAKESARVKKVLKYAMITTTIIGISLFAVVFLFTGQVIQIFVKANAEILSVGIPALRLYLSAFCIMNINILISGYFQSVGKEKIAIYVSIVRGFLLNIILAFVLPSVLPATILWAIVPLSELITLIGIAFYAKNSSTIENTALNEEFISA